MLKPDENELLTRVGPDTPMGSFMREYWVPAMLSSELPNPGCPPVRVLLLGEKLIAFRDAEGKVGLLQNACPHRGASLFFGRNDGCGLRCVYHGWQFDVTGQCIDMPNEPEQGDFKHRVKAQAYPTRERGGLVWAYLGPRKDAPPLPDLEANMSPESDQNIRVIQLDSSWLQILEGDIDTVHASLLHYGSLRADDQPPGTFSEYQLRQRSARFEVIDTEGGVAYGAYRPAGPGRWYWRIAQYLFPIYTMAPPGVLGLVRSAICRVPMDDHHTMNFFLSAGRRPVAAAQSDGRKPSPLGALVPLQPNTTDWYGRFRPVQQADNDFLIDRELQQRNKGPAGYSGIQTIVMQDAAMTSSMGPIYDRSKERLGSTDAAVIRVRRRLLAAVRAYLRGVTPPAVDDPEAYRARSGGIFLPEDADWVEATRALRRGMVEHPDLDPALNGPL